MMFYKRDEQGYQSPMEGVLQKTLVWGERTLMVEFKIKKGAQVPRHKHPHEQTGYVVSGRLRLKVGDETFLAEAGDAWCIGANVEHWAEVLEDSLVIEVFSPVREEFIPS